VYLLFISIQEAEVDVSEETRSLFLDLHRIVTALKAGDVGPALEYVQYALVQSSAAIDFDSV
jgi:hypothetical protein